MQGDRFLQRYFLGLSAACELHPGLRVAYLLTEKQVLLKPLLSKDVGNPLSVINCIVKGFDTGFVLVYADRDDMAFCKPGCCSSRVVWLGLSRSWRGFW
jgi:hypothetical protein